MKFKETTEEPQKETFVNTEIASVKKALEYKINLIQDTVNSIKESDISKKNFDLWFKLVDLLDYHNVTMKWVKGHESNKYNNLADLYCTHSATCLNIPEDENYKLSIQKIR